MSEELFNIPTVKSPRLRWIEKHDLRTISGTTAENKVEWAAWQIGRGAKTFKGDTEDDALAAWAKARGVRLWNEEGFHA